MISQPNTPILEGIKASFVRGLPVNKPDDLSRHESKQWWKLAHVARDQTGIDYTIDHTSGHLVLHPVR